MDRDHIETSLPVLQAGYDILLEKPICLDRSELLRLYDAAVKCNRKVIVCHVLRYAPFFDSSTHLKRRCSERLQDYTYSAHQGWADGCDAGYISGHKASQTRKWQRIFRRCNRNEYFERYALRRGFTACCRFRKNDEGQDSIYFIYKSEGFHLRALLSFIVSNMGTKIQRLPTLFDIKQVYHKVIWRYLLIPIEIVVI